MLRSALVLVVVALVHEASIPNVAAQDNPVVRELLRELIKKELAARDCKEKAWHQGNTWLWLHDPSANMAADVSSLTLQDGRVTMAGRASAVIAFDHKLATLVGSKTIGGRALVYLSFRCSAQAGETLTGSKFNIDRLEIHELRLRGDAGRAFQGMVENGVNLLLKHKKHDIEMQLEVAMNRAKMGESLRPNASHR